MSKTKYLVTIVGAERRTVFFNKEYCNLFLKRLEMSKEIYKYYLYAFSILPDHIHLFLEANNKDHLSKIIQYLKRHNSRDINNLFKLELINKYCKNNEFYTNYKIHKNRAISQSRLSALNNNVKSQEIIQDIHLNNEKIKEEIFNIHKFKWQKSYNKRVILNKTYFLNTKRYINNNHIKHEIDFFKIYKWSGLNKKFHSLIDK
jgi:REP element-mobilizing transposase RayT